MIDEMLYSPSTVGSEYLCLIHFVSLSPNVHQLYFCVDTQEIAGHLIVNQGMTSRVCQLYIQRDD